MHRTLERILALRSLSGERDINAHVHVTRYERDCELHFCNGYVLEMASAIAYSARSTRIWSLRNVSWATALQTSRMIGANTTCRADLQHTHEAPKDVVLIYASESLHNFVVVCVTVVLVGLDVLLTCKKTHRHFSTLLCKASPSKAVWVNILSC